MTDASGADTARDTDAATATMVTAEEAARLAGVSVRTVRRWIQHGHLPCIEGPAGKMVSPADIPAARQAARGRGHGGHGRPDTATDRDRDTVTAAVSVAAESQLALFRAQFVAPLEARVEELARENGRLEAERDAALAELASLRDAVVARSEAPGATEPPKLVSETLALRWRRWWRGVRGGER